LPLLSPTLGLMGKPPPGQQVFLHCPGLRHFEQPTCSRWGGNLLLEQPTLLPHPPCSRWRCNLLPLLLRCRVRTVWLCAGIGPAERSWGGVKNIKTGKQSHMSGELTVDREEEYFVCLSEDTAVANHV
jgi:hypothetical protein